MEDVRNILILEQASLELLPKRIQTHESALKVQRLFGVKPERQILDKNFHRSGILLLKDQEKRGRPDVVHFALLDATSTPLFNTGKIRIIIHTILGDTIILRPGTRPPRTLQRFCGVVSKLLSKPGEAEDELFETLGRLNFSDLLRKLEVKEVLSLTKMGIMSDLREIVRVSLQNNSAAWIVGGFAKGHFDPQVTSNSNRMISIHKESLPAHVVTARLSYDLERALKI
jgi:rRNA small subunit pseudouridine methyltransferase Nep1